MLYRFICHILFIIVIFIYEAKQTLNDIDKNKLDQIQLTKEQIIDFFEHKKRYGKFLSILELQTIQSFTKDDIEKIKSKLPRENIFEEIEENNNLKLKTSYTLSINFKRNFYDGDKKLLGSLNDVLIKFKLNDFRGVNFGVSMQKKRGEECFIFNSNKKIPFVFDISSNRYLFSTRSIFIEIKNKLIFKNIVIGNFKIGSGCGLVFNNVFGFGKTFDPIKILSIQNGIKTCLNDEKKLFGLATTVAIKKFSLLTFVSYNFLDASINSNKEVTYASRKVCYDTLEEVAKKDKLQEIAYGCSFMYDSSSEDFEIGVNFVATHFNKSFNLKNEKKLDYMFNCYNNYNASIFSRFLIGPIHFFFEYAKSFNKKYKNVFSFLKRNSGDAFICGFMTNIFKFIDYSCLFRKYNPSYYNFYGKGFFVNSSSNCSSLHGCACNEIGLYNSVLIKFFKSIDISLSVDWFKVLNPTLRYLNKGGIEIISQIKYLFLDKEYLILSCKYKKGVTTVALNKYKKERVALIKIMLNKKICDIFVSNTTILLPINCLFSVFNRIRFCIYECIDFHYRRITSSLFFTIANGEGTHISIKEKDDITSTKINSKYFKVGVKVGYNFIFGLNLNLLFYYNYKYDKKCINIPYICVNITYKW